MPGCTVSQAIYSGSGLYVSHFSMADGTSISAECYEYPRMYLVAEGSLEMFSEGHPSLCLEKGWGALPPLHVPTGVRTAKGCIYTEIGLRKESEMNASIKEGSVFSLKDLLPYQEGKIINMDLINDEHMKFVLMSFDAGTGLSEHAAPGEALLFVLEGKAIIGYEGTEHPVSAGDNFKFAKLGKHYVKADGRFKMALLLTLDD